MNVCMMPMLLSAFLPAPDFTQDPNAKDQLIAQQTQEIEALTAQVDAQKIQNTYFKIMSLRPSTRPDVAKSVAKVVLIQAAKNDIDPDLLLALIRVESYFEPRAVSWSGARGLTQVLYGYWKGECGLTMRNVYDVETNITCGIHILLTYQQKYNNLSLALVSYNQGPELVDYLIEHHRRINYGYAKSVHYFYNQLKAYETSIDVNKGQKLLGF